MTTGHMPEPARVQANAVAGRRVPTANGCRWHRVGGHLGLLITDPYHPVTAATITALRGNCASCLVVGIAPTAGAVPAPPGVDIVEACPDGKQGGFVSTVADIVARHMVDVVLPWTDRDALALSGVEDVLAERGATLVCPPAKLVELACDKWATVEQLRALGVRVPASQLVAHGDELAQAATLLGYPQRPLVLKPRALSGGRGVWTLRADADPFAIWPLPELPLEAMVAALDQGVRRSEAASLIVQEQLEGADVSVDVLAEEGEVVAAVARSRTASLGGLCVEGTVRSLHPAERAVLATIVDALGWSSLANVQLVAGPAGPVVYEINARAAGSIAVSTHAGLDLLAAAITMVRTGHPGPLPGESVSPVGFRRHWSDQHWPVLGDDPL